MNVNNYTSINNDIETCRADTTERIFEEIFEVPLQADDDSEDTAQEPQELAVFAHDAAE